MSIGDNSVVSIYRMAQNADNHWEYPEAATYSGVRCSIIRMSPFREEQAGLGARVLGYDMHIGQALTVLVGDKVVDQNSVSYDVFGVDIIRDVDTFTRLQIKREYVEPS